MTCYLSRITSSSLRSAKPLAPKNVIKVATKLVTKTHLSSATSCHYACLAIGTSTGGPVALQKILTELPSDYTISLYIVQHMSRSLIKFSSRLLLPLD